MCCVCLGLDFHPLLNIAQRLPSAAQVYLLQHCRGMKKWASLCSPLSCGPEPETSAPATAQALGQQGHAGWPPQLRTTGATRVNMERKNGRAVNVDSWLLGLNDGWLLIGESDVQEWY